LTPFHKSTFEDVNWQKFAESCVTVVIKEHGKTCEGGCGKVLSVGDVACKVTNNKGASYYCRSCYNKMKNEKRRHVSHVEKKQPQKDKWSLW
jgi:hypothetical protein